MGCGLDKGTSRWAIVKANAKNSFHGQRCSIRTIAQKATVPNYLRDAFAITIAQCDQGHCALVFSKKGN